MNITNNLQNGYIKVTVSIQGTGKKYYQAYLQYKENGQQKYKTKTTGIPVNGGSKKLAKEKAEEIRQQFELELNSADDQSSIPFGKYIVNWLENHKHNIEITTYSRYKGIVETTADYFNKLGITLQELKASDLQKYYQHLQQTKNIKNKTIRRYHANIRKSLQKAVQLDLIESNPASKIQLDKVEQYIPQHYNANELKKLFEISKNDLIYLHILITAHYGLRKSEVVGLKWDAIDFENNTITIKHVVTNASINGKTILIKKDRTKNISSKRTLPLFEKVKQALLKEKAKQEEDKKFFGNSYKNKDNYILVDDEGNLIKPDRVVRRFKNLLLENNLKIIRFHDLRHSCATLLLALGYTLEQIKVWLGHSSIATTEHYANDQVIDKKVLANGIEKALDRKSA